MSETLSPADGSVESVVVLAELGQVCDRCRLKKIKCNGSTPCDKCSAVSAQCRTSTRLRRKTKARGFSSSEADAVKRLEDENAELKKKLQAESQAKQCLQDQLNRGSYAPTRKKRRIENHLAPISSGSESTTLDRDAFVVKHMGRLVRDDADMGRFAGSTTGVHFILSVQDICRSQLLLLEPFPEMCYKSYLLQPRHDTSMLYRAGMEMRSLTVQDARNAIGMNLEDVARHLHVFETYWSGFCPAVLREQILQRTRNLLEISPAFDILQSEDHAVLQTILLTVLINGPSEAEVDMATQSPQPSRDRMLQLVCQIHHLVSTRVEIWSLQALVVFSLYVQKSGKRQWMIPLNGVMVQMAQSLGLHRHARRFKFAAGEVEWRKRLWWSVYAFDKLTAVVHGLPQLVHDVDVDNDFPVDCLLQDATTTQLSHPLPGEPTPVSIFCHYVKLTRIVSRMLAQLYTTTDRRGGADKIKQLDLDLRVWASELNKHPHVNRLDLGDIIHRRKQHKDLEVNILVVPWLELLANMIRILIHLPGLTFDSSTSQFRDSLERCVLSSLTIIRLLNDDDLDSRVSILSPCGPSIVFQCGLLQIFSQCQTPAEGQHKTATRNQSRDTLYHSVNLLEELAPAYNENPASEDISPLSSLAGTLMRLQVALDSHQTPGYLFPEFSINSGLVTSPRFQASDPITQADPWSTTELESLNQFGDIDSLFNFIPTFN